MSAGSPQRFAPIALDAMTPEQRFFAQSLLDGPRRGIRGPFNALLRNPTLADRVRALGDSIRFESSLPADLREFVILLVARFWSARYEWHAHSKVAIEAGVAPAVVDAIGRGRTPDGMTPDQALLHRFCSEMLQHKDVADATYAETLERFGETTLLDVMATAGYFSFVSVILNTIRAPVPEGGAQLPPVDA
ncbi:MAG: carboxymuconolactone decarboxylase family protein [Comamonadaceae bacterium]|nr:MAG: carboxymuconolactone decarboxylase family protein [Comamonadaceae bacterium]